MSDAQRSIWLRVTSVKRLQNEIVRLEQELQRAQNRVKALEGQQEAE